MAAEQVWRLAAVFFLSAWEDCNERITNTVFFGSAAEVAKRGSDTEPHHHHHHRQHHHATLHFGNKMGEKNEDSNWIIII